jgi:hypothetical protein
MAGVVGRRSHRDLERLLRGFNQAYDACRQRVRDGRSHEEVVRKRVVRNKRLTNLGYEPPADLCVLPRALLVVEAAKDVLQPGS